jgi:hypothetical protein
MDYYELTPEQTKELIDTDVAGFFENIMLPCSGDIMGYIDDMIEISHLADDFFVNFKPNTTDKVTNYIKDDDLEMFKSCYYIYDKYQQGLAKAFAKLDNKGGKKTKAQTIKKTLNAKYKSDPILDRVRGLIIGKIGKQLTGFNLIRYHNSIHDIRSMQDDLSKKIGNVNRKINFDPFIESINRSIKRAVNESIRRFIRYNCI